MKGAVLINCSMAETKEALLHNVDAMHTVYSTAEMKEALCEGNAGGTDQMGRIGRSRTCCMWPEKEY